MSSTEAHKQLLYELAVAGSFGPKAKLVLSQKHDPGIENLSFSFGPEVVTQHSPAQPQR